MIYVNKDDGLLNIERVLKAVLVKKVFNSQPQLTLFNHRVPLIARSMIIIIIRVEAIASSSSP